MAIALNNDAAINAAMRALSVAHQIQTANSTAQATATVQRVNATPVAASRTAEVPNSVDLKV
jgi:hypothetical protein